MSPSRKFYHVGEKSGHSRAVVGSDDILDITRTTDIDNSHIFHKSDAHHERSPARVTERGMELPNLKCVVVGDGAVGKTSLLLTYTSNAFPDNHVPTVFDNYITTVRSRITDEFVQVHLFDTAGQEDYDHIRPLSYPKTDVFLLCFSVVNPDSLRHVEHVWVPEVRKWVADAKIILVGTKLDLKDSDDEKMRLRQYGKNIVTLEEVQKLQRRCKIKEYYESSSRHNKGLHELFQGVVDMYLTNQSSEQANDKSKSSCTDCSIQ